MKLTRRSALKTAAATAVGISIAPATSPAQMAKKKANPNYRIQKGRIKQSIMGWTFNPMPTPELAKLSKDVGLVAMEGISRNHYPLVRELGMDVSLVGSHGFKKGPVDPRNHDECIKKLTEAIELCAGAGYKRVITFTGMKAEGIDAAEAEKNCIDCWKKVIPLAEKKKITLCLEHLNSRDDTHPMKGHPGYFGDDVDHCVKMIEKVGSPSFKLLFDVYHVQIMEGDLVHRFEDCLLDIGHIQIANPPDRREPDEGEINYPFLFEAIDNSGYDGWIGCEYIPCAGTRSGLGWGTAYGLKAE